MGGSMTGRSTGAVSLIADSDPSIVRRKAIELSAFFARVREVLAARRMSQMDLARELGVGAATVSEWFTRGRVPNGDVMLRLPHVLAVNGHWLLTGEGLRESRGMPQDDPYRRGAEDALREVQESLSRSARRFGAALGDGGTGGEG
jgi:transcriptional regulator with XRE-family HTH domain